MTTRPPVIHVQTEIPGPRSRALQAERDQYVSRSISITLPVYIASATGVALTDVDGNTFLDFGAGIGTLNVGSSDPRVSAAIREQVDLFLHTCFSVTPYESYVRLCQRLIGLMPGTFAKKAALFNSGAEAVENSIKFARHYTGRQGVIVFNTAFHGRTLLALTMTAKANPYKLGFGPFVSDIYRVPFADRYRCAFCRGSEGCTGGCGDDFVRQVSMEMTPAAVAAVIFEPIQGEGGFVVAPRPFARRVADFCRDNGIVFIADEVQTGFGRTGRFLASEHYGLEPDMICLAKSIGAGLPLSAVVGRAEILDHPQVGGIGGTYAGNPVACAAALAVLDIMESDSLPKRAQEIGQIIGTRFTAFASRYTQVGDVRGLGAMWAMELVTDRQTRQPDSALTARIASACHRRGLIALTAGVYSNVIRILVPLIATDDDVLEGLDVLAAALDECCP